MNISIVTPTWNRSTRLCCCLESVAEQQKPPSEHIIVDNMSTDHTTTIIAEYAASVSYPVRHVREADGGIYEAMNKGIALAQGDVLHFLNDDDMLYGTDALEVMGRCLSQTGADIVFGDVVLLCKSKFTNNYRRHRQVNRLTLVERTITQQAIFYRRSIFARCKSFDPHLRIAADHEWLLRAFLEHGISGVYLKRPVALFRTGGVSNNPMSQEKHRKEREQVTRQYFSPTEIRAARIYRKVLRKLPLGASLLNLFVPLRLNVMTLREKGDGFVPDCLARLDL